ncbi:MAG: GIY-YIG nuclease family protein [Pseudolabrys sp.]|nr:GIY-YIG nuclease family protein [Pseudolabrys sp.]
MGEPRVYFIECTGKIKIGFTKNLHARLATFRTAHPDQITLIGSVPGSMRFERELHARLGIYAIKGEWFQDCQEVRNVIACVMVGAIEPARRPVEDFLKELETTTKARPTPSWLSVLTSEQLRLFGLVLDVRDRSGKLMSAYADCESDKVAEARSILTLLSVPFKALVADCFFPTVGRDEEETLAYERALEIELVDYLKRAEFALQRAAEVLNAGPFLKSRCSRCWHTPCRCEDTCEVAA